MGAGFTLWAQLFAQSSSAQTTGGAAAPTELQEVVVTAERREERLQDVPISVGVFSKERLDAQGLRSVDDLTRFSPGVTFIRDGTGSSANYNDENSDINIRGVDSSSGASTVAVYIDDTPIQSRRIGFGTLNTFPVIFDLDHVEVLRGPQGTLFGAGSEGGNVRFILPQPSTTNYSAYARAELASTHSGDPTYEAGGAVGGPLIEGMLGFRASASYRREGGWVDRVDRTTLAVVEKSANWQSFATARLAFKWAATDKLTISPSFYVQELKINDTAVWWPRVSDPGAGTYRDANAQANPSTDPFYLAAVRADWDLGAVRLFSNTSFYSRNQHSISDYTQYDRAAYYNLATLLGVCNPPCSYLPAPGDKGSAYFTDTQNNFYQEIRLESTDPSARLTWTAGVFYAHLNENSTEFIVDRSLDAEFPPSGNLVCFIPCPGGLIYSQPYYRVIDKQLAGFGEVDFKLTDTLKAIAGVRVSDTRYDGSSNYSGPFVSPLTYHGELAFNDVSGTQPPSQNTAKWKAFQANPLLNTAPQYPWNDPSTDTRIIWCWLDSLNALTTADANCQFAVKNLASRVPWDAEPHTGVTTDTTTGNNATTGEAWLSPLTAGGTHQQPMHPDRAYIDPWANVWSQGSVTAPGFTSRMRFTLVTAGNVFHFAADCDCVPAICATA